jgi:hypothetical protein
LSFCLSVGARLVIVLLLSASAAAAQSAVVSRNVNLRLDSSADQLPINLLVPPTALELLRPDAEDGYFNVRTAEGLEGWVWGKNITIAVLTPGEATPTAAPTAAAEFSKAWARPEPNKSSFSGPSGSCGSGGLGAENVSNKRKNRTDIPSSYHDVSFRALADLPVPKGPKNRSAWIKDDLEILAEIEQFEGVAVRVVGFLVAVKPQTGSEEGTNCRFSTAGETDWHMALTEKAGQGEEDSVVVETTPRIRKKHPKWTKSRLSAWTDTSQPVRISGWVFFDTEHRNHLGKFRSTLWEVHPVTKIEVLKNGKWIDLDALPQP